MAVVIDLSAATSAEGQIWQLANALSEVERLNVDADGAALTDNIQVSIDSEASQATIAVTVPLVTATTADGVTYIADPFLP